jgi:polyisoprenoid-binding protein YceI
MRVHSLFLRTSLPALALSLALPVVAWTPGSAALVLQPESRLWVEGTSTMKSFTCKAGEVDALVDATPDAVKEIAAGRKAVRTVRVRVEAPKLDCGNGTMNDHMWKALKTGDHKVIEFTLSGYDVARGPEGVTGTLEGTLDLGGVQKPIAIAAVGRTEGSALRVTGSYPLDMKDYGLKPPTLMMGTMKVGRTVTVKFDLVLKS